MKARDVMASFVIAVAPDLDVRAVANTLVGNNISAVPVVGLDGKLQGIISEGDLMRRAETGTERRRSWWLELFTSSQQLAAEFVKSHALKASDIMTRKVVTAGPEASLREIANLLETHGIKRVPIVQDGYVLGIVSRANLVQALASQAAELHAVPGDDSTLRESVVKNLSGQPWGKALVNVFVRDGVVDLWGLVQTDEERRAIRVTAESTPGVRAVNDNLRINTFVSGL